MAGGFRTGFVDSSGHILEQVGAERPRADGHTFLLALIPCTVGIPQFDALAVNRSKNAIKLKPIQFKNINE